MSKQVSWAGKKQFAAYKSQNRYSNNKKRKLERHLKKYPSDAKAKAILENGLKNGFSYTRKSPIAPQWSKSDKKMLTLMHSIDGITGKEFLAVKKERLRINRKDSD